MVVMLLFLKIEFIQTNHLEVEWRGCPGSSTLATWHVMFSYTTPHLVMKTLCIISKITKCFSPSAFLRELFVMRGILYRVSRYYITDS